MKTLRVIAATAILAASTTANAWWGPFDNDNGYNNGSYNGFGNGNGYGDGYGYGDGDGQLDGDFDTSFSFNMKARGHGRGNGRAHGRGYGDGYGYNDYRGNSTNGYGPYGYAPHAAPALTEEQIKEMQKNAKAQREAFEKAQKEAFERHQEAMKNAQAQMPAAPVAPTPAPAFARPGFAQAPAFEAPEKPEWVKEIDAQRAERMKSMPVAGQAPEFKDMDKRHAEFIKETDERRAAMQKEFEERRAASKKRHEEFMKKFDEAKTEKTVEEKAVEKKS